MPRIVANRLLALSFLTLIVTAAFSRGQEASKQIDADALDKRIIAEAVKGSEIMTNLTYLSDMIGPRITGSPGQKKASEWSAVIMKKYGLAGVQLEPWSIPEGWERGPCTGKIIEPDNGRNLSLASLAWYPGTNGKIEGHVVVIQAKKPKDLEAYKGKLKGAIILNGPPAKLKPWNEIEKPGGLSFSATDGQPDKTPIEERLAMAKALREFLKKEDVAAVFTDSGKHFGLLMTTGGFGKYFGADRPSAVPRPPTLAVSHDHYALLHRLATRPDPARTRIELQVSNKFIPGPIVVHNTVGEIKGSEKPEEVVIVGAHLDSWDLGQGTLDNGTGSCVVLETARILQRCGSKPKRTIRFILFTGEEQGLHGSKTYVTKHKEEMPRVSAALIHDTGTGKVTGLGWLGRQSLKPILEAELGVLKTLGVTDMWTRAGRGSDHVSFDEAGVPGMAVKQDIAGYRFGHHSQADTLAMAREADLIQGAQVLAVTAMRLANRAQLLPRDKK
jgi:hypothetical protein